MKKLALIFGFLPFAALAETDAQIALNDAINMARKNCSDISGKMENIKKMAVAGTAVNAVGTAAGVGAEVAASVQSMNDMKLMDNVDLDFYAESDGAVRDYLDEYDSYLDKVDAGDASFVVAGNVATGLFAADTATNIAGAAISSKTVADKDLIEQIKHCVSSMDVLRNARMRVKIEDGENEENMHIMDKSQNILSKCGEYEYVNLQQLNNLAKGAIITNSIGAATGTAATIVNALNNTKSQFDIYNHDTGTVEYMQNYRKHEKMTIATNMLGGATAAASLTGTVLNASQIKTVKQALNISQECEEALAN